MIDLTILLIILPLAAALPAFVEKVFPKVALSRPSAIASLTVSLVLLFFLLPEVYEGKEYMYPLGGWRGEVAIVLKMDGIAWVGSLMVIILSLASLLYAWPDKRFTPLFWFFSMIMVAGMQGVVLTHDIFNMFVFLEIIGIAVYILIAFFSRKHSLVASFKYMILSSVAMSFFLLGVLMLYRHTGSFSLAEIAVRLKELNPSGYPISVALGCLVVGLGVRVAFIPFHTWLPDAHTKAPHPISSILSGIVLKVAFIALWRILWMFGRNAFSMVFFWIGGGTALLAVIWALAQTDMKRLLAFHSVSQMGYIVASFGAGTAVSVSASLYHAFSHALFKGLLFLAIGVVMNMTGERHIDRLGGLWRAHIGLFITFLVGAASIAGFPPFNGFISKKLILSGVKYSAAVYYMIWLTGIGTVASFIKLSGVFRGGKGFSVERRSLKGLKYFSLSLLSVLCLATGLFPGFWFGGIYRMIYRSLPEVSFKFYTAENLLDFLVVFALGFVLYLGIKSRWGKSVTEFIRGIRVDFHTSLLLLVAGFLGLSVLL